MEVGRAVRVTSWGPLIFGSNTGQYFRARVQAPWFAYWLKDKGQLPLHEALTFETGNDQWKQYDSWPPRQATARNLYFREDGKLSFDAPMVNYDLPFDSYISDPAHPV